MEAYKTWVRQNRQLITSLEGIASTLTWILPERFTSSEVGAESVAALLGLMTAVNQHIIDTAPHYSNHAPGLPGMHASLNKDPQGHLRLPFCLSIIKELEVLIEVMSEHYKGQDKKWNVLSAVEAIKACLRFLILHRGGYRMLLHGGETLPGVSGPVASHRGSGSAQVPLVGGRPPTRHPFSDPMGSSGASGSLNASGLERKAALALMKFGENVGGVTARPSWIDRYQSNVQTPAAVPSYVLQPVPLKSWEFPDELSVVGEWLFILRPLLYVLLVRRYGIKSWKPFVTSFILDVMSMGSIFLAETLKKKASDGEHRGAIPPLSRDEGQEFRRRQLLLALYLMRDPFFSKFSRHPLTKAEQVLRPVPILGTLGEKVIEFVIGIQARYCYTSGS